MAVSAKLMGCLYCSFFNGWQIMYELFNSTATFLTFLSGVYIAHQTHKHFLLTRASRLIERFNSHEFAMIRVDVDRILKTNVDWDNLLRKYHNHELGEAEEEKIIKLRLFANFFQEISVAYLHGSINKKYTGNFFKWLIPYYWMQLEPFIQAFRNYTSKSRLYSEFKKTSDLLANYP